MPLVKKKKQPLVKQIALGLLLLLLVAGYVAYDTFQVLSSPVTTESQLVNFEVVAGDTMTSVLARLEEEGVIRNRYVARFLLRNQRVMVYRGNFMLDKSSSVSDIMSILSDPTAAIQNTVRITLPPGFWAKHMAERIATFTSVTAEELLALWNDEAFVTQMIQEYPVLTNDILRRKDDVRVLLEGYLSPNTYEFFVDTNAEAITRILLNETQRVFERNRELFANSGRSIHDVFIMASIVEFEAFRPEDKRMVAGVFYNRLRINMRLQASPTVCYALYEFSDWRECESYANQRINSPFNTYVITGLPAGPIMNPSEIALVATLDYTPSRYFYFLADVHGDRTIHFAETFAQHQANIDRYLRRR